MKKALFIALAIVGCREPLTPRAASPYSIHLLGAGGTALRGQMRADGIVFTGRVNRDYWIGIGNESREEIGISVVIDGIDARTGEPAPSCEQRCSFLSPSELVITRGFAVDDTHVSSYRFTTPERSLASITKGARKEAIGTIEACVFSSKPAPPGPPAHWQFSGTVETAPEAVPGLMTGELEEEPPAETANKTCDRLLRRLVAHYEAEDGTPLATAPPPAGVAHLAPPPRDVSEDVVDDDMPVKPPKGWKPPKRDKRQKPPK